jgi:predicted DCC family thiol-disulfide oxidoreductase YuxK
MPAAPDCISVLYDGACPFCVRDVRFMKRHDRAHRLELVDIAAPGFDASAYGLSAAAVSARFHVVRADGTAVSGMEAFRVAFGAIGKGALVAPTGWPVLRPLFDLLYTLFARNRVRLGRLFGRRCDGEACAPR